MTTLTAYAPGKLFIFGEWSVLRGHPALLVSTEVGQRATYTVAGERPLTLRVHGSGSHRTFVDATAGGLLEVSDRTSPPAFDPIGQVLATTSRPLRRSGLLQIEPDGLRHPAGDKLGFGSSASCAALAAWAAEVAAGDDVPDLGRVLELAWRGHHRAQSGRGSGADVAVAVAGLSSRGFAPPRFSEVTPGGGQPPTITPHVPPDGLAILAVWTGRVADSRALMTQVERLATERPDEHDEHMDRIASSAANALSAWRDHDVEAILHAVVDQRTALSRLGHAARTDIVCRAHHDIEEIVATISRTAACKPSGAGGGDMTLVFCEPEAEGAIVDAVGRGKGRLGSITYSITGSPP